MIIRMILVIGLLFAFQNIAIAHEKESKVEVETVIVKEVVWVSENGTRVKIVLGDDSKFYVVAIASPPEVPEE